MVEHSCDIVADLSIAPEVGPKKQIPLDRYRPEQTPALRHVSHAFAHESLWADIRDVLAGERDGARAGANEAAHDTQESRFPRAVCPDERDQLGRTDIEVDPEQHRSGVEARREAADFEQRLTGGDQEGLSCPRSVRSRLA